MEENEKLAEEKFVPRGAIAFFVALILFAAFIWFGIYFLMISQVS